MTSEAEVLAYENYAHYNNDLYGTPEPPRALPLHHNGDISDRMPSGGSFLLEDQLYSIQGPFINYVITYKALGHLRKTKGHSK